MRLLEFGLVKPSTERRVAVAYLEINRRKGANHDRRGSGLQTADRNR